jgi:hypothetical protein
VRNGIYCIHGKQVSKNTCLREAGKDDKLKLNVRFNKKLSVQHLLLTVNFNETTVDTDNESDTDNEEIIPDSKSKNKRRKLSEKQIAKCMKETMLWHQRFAHASAPCVFKNTKVTLGMSKVFSENRVKCCEVCALAKFVRKKFDEKREKASRPGQILHCDLVGPIKPKTFRTKKQYILVVLDDFSHYLQTFVMATKDETSDMMETAMAAIQSEFPGPGLFQKVRCDKGGEFHSNKF